jgi:hypothetical protein
VTTVVKFKVEKGLRGRTAGEVHPVVCGPINTTLFPSARNCVQRGLVSSLGMISFFLLPPRNLWVIR